MRRYATSRRKKKRSESIAGIGSRVLRAAVPAAVVLAVAYLVFFTGLFELREVRFNGGRSVPGDSLRAVTSEFLGTNILTARTSEMRAGLLGIPEVRRVDFRRRLFHRIDCYVQERVPVALIAGEALNAVDEDGVVIPSRCGPWDVDLPIISGLKEGHESPGREKTMLLKALEVLSLLKEFDFSPAEQLSEIHVDGEDIILVWMGTGSLVLVGRDGYLEKIRKFRAVYGALEEEDIFPESIDLRFERQVVIR